MSSHDKGSTHAVARDPVNQVIFDLRERIGLARLGAMNSQVWYQDPKRLVFTLARYKFVAKMLKGKDQVLEIGCGDGFGARIVKQEVQNLTVTDFDPLLVEEAKGGMIEPWVYEAKTHDILEAPVPGAFDAAYSLDVMEHIPEEMEERYLRNIISSLKPHGVLIVGMPSLESQTYASAASKAGHVNCKNGETLRSVMQKHFHNVFMFSMNDEVVHTGFMPMAHYVFAVCATPRYSAGT